ncbi:MAG TPA: sorbosone dehydrogenase family protein [Stellaceae bacterium]|nr:sorbosone dehydrogenase family protein [Stellaceae bacterium]
MPRPLLLVLAALLVVAASFLAIRVSAPAALRPHDKRFADWHADRPGLARRITPADMPAPFATPPTIAIPKIVPRPPHDWPQLPRGFAAEIFANGLDHPRQIKVAPNGDIFVAESKAGRIRVLHADSSGTLSSEVFAEGLNLPFGIAFYPSGTDPRFVYIGDTDAVLRFPYHTGDRVARGPAETVLRGLPVEGHWTRDLVFSPDDRRLFVAVGSLSNDAEGLAPRDSEAIGRFEMTHGTGAAWGKEENRALVLSVNPDGGDPEPFATGLRNCVAMAVEPRSKSLWCTNNERDQLGDDLVPDFVTRIQKGGFYGWPWYYIGPHEDPFHRGQRPDLVEAVTTPDVLLQAHSAPLGIAFYTGRQFPAAYRGDAFVALHGSYNRSQRTGYKVVRLRMSGGKPTGTYEDFMTGFIAAEDAVWGRPVGVAVAADGALLVSEDANGTIWRVTYRGEK